MNYYTYETTMSGFNPRHDYPPKPIEPQSHSGWEMCGCTSLLVNDYYAYIVWSWRKKVS